MKEKWQHFETNKNIYLLVADLPNKKCQRKFSLKRNNARWNLDVQERMKITLNGKYVNKYKTLYYTNNHTKRRWTKHPIKDTDYQAK